MTSAQVGGDISRGALTDVHELKGILFTIQEVFLRLFKMHE